jgi:citrate/tricarballylate utilization protein
MPQSDALREADRVMTICNACRYCEGLCAVFPAMEMRRTFTSGDLDYLANLCHQCGACFYDCQYAPPHEFKVNVPDALARLRQESYARYAWPSALGGTFERNGLLIAVLTALAVAAFIAGFVAFKDPAVLFGRHNGAFYALMPHGAMVALFGGVALYVVLALTLSLRAFWRGAQGSIPVRADGRAWAEAGRDAGHLRYLHGGGGGCMNEDEHAATDRRRLWHHFTFFGFLLCFASTSVATLYHYAFGWPAPYPWFSAPVVLGTIGGIGLIVGPVGLLAAKRRRDRAIATPSSLGMDVAFLVMLFLTSATGLLLLVLRDTAAMGMLLALHLGVVLALFLSMPYGKFVHGLYRFAALVKYAAERRSGRVFGQE